LRIAKDLPAILNPFLPLGEGFLPEGLRGATEHSGVEPGPERSAGTPKKRLKVQVDFIVPLPAGLAPVVLRVDSFPITTWTRLSPRLMYIYSGPMTK
jgi:hypothetical protein